MPKNKEIESSYSAPEVAVQLRRLADALEKGKAVVVQIAGKRITIPPQVTIDFEYERRGLTEEVEIEISWKRPRKKK